MAREWEVSVNKADNEVIIEHFVFDIVVVSSEKEAVLFINEFVSACKELGWNVTE